MGFNNICSFLINDKWYNERKKDIANDRERIVMAAAKLTVSQIREMENDKVNYPSLQSAINTFLRY